MKVTVYTTNHCPSCVTLKKWLDSKDIQYNLINVEDNPQEQAQLIEKTGSFLVPITVVEHSDGVQEVIQGTLYGQLKKALNLV